MLSEGISIPQSDMKKLLGAASPDAALLYLYVHSGNGAGEAQRDLHMPPSRISCATAILRQLGLWPEERRIAIAPGERPDYSETDVTAAVNEDASFRGLYGEVQRLLGRSLNVEELKILLGFTRYLNLPTEVISLLICYCRDRARQRGSLRAPSLRTIEKEAYAWAERGIDTLEEAAAYIQSQTVRNSRISRLKDVLQIRGRGLTPGEEKYAQRWLDMGFEEAVISMAYDRTCMNTGGLNWPYMNKILQRWDSQGLHTVEAVQNGDRKADYKAPGQRQLDAEEQAAIRKMMEEG